MNYFKILINDTPIGAVSSDDFVFRRPSGGFCTTTDEYGELVFYKNEAYRATWMLPIDYEYSYTEASILAISEDEYNAFKHAEESDEPIPDFPDDEEEQPVPVDPIEQATVEYLRAAKIREMSNACRTTIEAGFDVELHGENQHFSLSTQDQLNLMNLSIMAQTQNMIPYHADDELCVFYTADEINQIVAAASEHRTYHTTYYNALKNYINSLDTIEAISSVTYGIEIPDEYKSDVLVILEQ